MSKRFPTECLFQVFALILSAIVGIFATLSLAIKTYWYKLKAFFSGKKDSEHEAAAPDAADPSREDSRAP